MRRVRFFCILWDGDDDEDLVDLPRAYTTEVEDEFNVHMDGADLLSDKFGWCVEAFLYEELTNGQSGRQDEEELRGPVTSLAHATDACDHTV